MYVLLDNQTVRYITHFNDVTKTVVQFREQVPMCLIGEILFVFAITKWKDFYKTVNYIVSNFPIPLDNVFRVAM